MKNRSETGWRLASAAVLALAIGSGAWWLRHDSLGPASWDQSRHARNALAMVDILRDVGGDHTLLDLALFYDFYPPLAYLPTVFFHLVLGRDYDVACLSVLLFWLPLLFVFTVLAAMRLLGRREAYLAGIVVISFPTIVALSRDYLTDLQTATVTAGVLWLLARANLLLTPHALRAILVGVGVGAALLVRWSMPIFLLGPFLIAAVRGLRRAPGRFAFNALSAGVSAFAIAAPWYYLNRRDLLHGLLFGIQYGDEVRYPAVFSMDSITWYARSLAVEHLLLPMILLCGVGLVLLLRRRRRLLGFIAVCLAVSYLGLTLARNKESRFAVGLLPYAALVASASVCTPRPRLRQAVAAATVVAGSLNIGAINNGIDALPTRVGHGLFTVYRESPFPWVRPPSRSFFDPAGQVELDTRALWTCRGFADADPPAVVDLAVDRLWLSPYRLKYHAQLHRSNLRIAGRPEAPFLDIPGWPAAGPPARDFLIALDGQPPRPTENWIPLARYPTHTPTANGPEEALLYAQGEALRRGAGQLPIAMFTDVELGNALCFLGATLSEAHGDSGPRLRAQLDWIVGATGRTRRGKRLEYYRTIEAIGPSNIGLTWIGPTTWEAGEQRAETVELALPGNLPAGDYEIRLRMSRRPFSPEIPPTPMRLAAPGLAREDFIPLGRIRLGGGPP